MSDTNGSISLAQSTLLDFVAPVRASGRERRGAFRGEHREWIFLEIERRRALAILAEVGPRGYPKFLLLNAHGFTARTLDSLVGDEFVAPAPGRSA